jgi:hypothetical protein
MPGGVDPQQLAQVRGGPEGVGDHGAGGERDRSVDPSLPERDEVRSRREPRGVPLRDALQLGGIGSIRETESDWLHNVQCVAGWRSMQDVVVN